MLYRVVAVVLCCLLTVSSGPAQQQTPKRNEEPRAALARMKPGTALELELTDGSKLSGYLEEIRADTVRLRNSKTNSGAPREIAFSQIRRARRTSHTPVAAWIVVGVVAGVAIAVIVALTKYLHNE